MTRASVADVPPKFPLVCSSASSGLPGKGKAAGNQLQRLTLQTIILNTLVVSRVQSYRLDAVGRSHRLAAAKAEMASARAQELRTPQPASYNVLSYNICWGCISAQPRDRSAMYADLGRDCMKKVLPKGWSRKITQCADNMATGVKSYSDSIGGYDFLGFQEALVPFADDVVARLNEKQAYEVVKLPRLPILTLYKKSRFTKPDVITGGGFKGERPSFMILVFDTEKLIYINVHNDHGSYTARFAYKFSRALEQDAFKIKSGRREYRVILVGDFNDIRALLPGKLKLPWMYEPLNLTTPLANTCCTAHIKKLATRPGDYIFDSASPATNRVPLGYDAKLAQSDHCPVEAVLAR